MNRRQLLKTGAFAMAAAGLGGIGRRAAAQSGEVVVASFGGRFQDAQRKAIFEPFQAATGIRVVEATGISVAKIRTMVMTGNVEWDLFVAPASDLYVMAAEELLDPVDYSAIDPSLVAELPDAAKHEYGFGGIYVSQVIAYNTEAFPTAAQAPASWADAWNVEKFPGRRMFPAGNYSVTPIEAALLADGVPMDEIYPIDLDRAYAALSRIRPHVAKWVTSSSAVPQALVDGEVSVGYANSARIGELKAQGAPVDFTWNEAIYFVDYWAVPKGAPNFGNAMKFMEFAARAEQQAALVREMKYGPTNPKALALLTAEEQAQVSSSPELLARQLRIDAGWWSSRDDSGRTQMERNFEKWNRWIAG